MSDEGPWYISFGPGGMTDQEWELMFWRKQLIFWLTVRAFNLNVANVKLLLGSGSGE